MAKSGMDLVNEARGRIQETSVEAVRKLVDGKADVVLLDVREADEVAGGLIPGARWVPRGFLELKMEALEPRREREVVVYCAGGVRSALAADTLRQMGYDKVRSMAGGFRTWIGAGHPVQRP
jgi:rhodanese-related sulfurtransferase